MGSFAALRMTTKNKMMKKVAIVGGGVAGLAAAYELARLARNGAAVQGVLFEASTRLGGIVETVREGGFVIECGPDAWVTEKPWARELAEELGLGRRGGFGSSAAGGFCHPPPREWDIGRCKFCLGYPQCVAYAWYVWCRQQGKGKGCFHCGRPDTMLI